MIDDSHLHRALDLLDRIGELQYHRTFKEARPEDVAYDTWHRAEDVLTAMMVIDRYDTKAIMNQQLAMAEARMRQLGIIPDKVKLDG